MSTKKELVEKLIQADKKKTSGWKNWLPSLFSPPKEYQEIPEEQNNKKSAESVSKTKSTSYGSYSS